MEAATSSSSSLNNCTTTTNPPRLHRTNRPLQLPTVCVNDIGQQQNLNSSNFTAAMVAAISAAQAQSSPLNSPVFINTEMIIPSTSTSIAAATASGSIISTTPQTFHGIPTHHHQQQQPSVALQQQQQLQDLHAFRLASGGATSAMLHERWFSDYRHERTSSSSSDSGIIFQFSPPGAAHLGPCPSSASLSISPPGLSPLQLDSAFSTPTPSSSNRFRSHFTFDHVMSPVRRKNDSSAFDLSSSVLAAAAAAANLQHQQQQTSAAVLNEIIKRASTASTSSSSGIASSSISTADFEEEIKRKQEEIVAAAANAASVSNSMFQSPIKSAVFRTESLPAVRFPLQCEVEKMMQTFYSNQPPQQPQQPQFLQRSPVVRTSSLNVTSPPFFQPLPQSPLNNQQLRPSFGSAQSAFRAPSTFVQQPQQPQSTTLSSLLPPPPTILKTAPSPPQKQRKKTKSSTSPVPEEMDETKRQYFCTTCNKDFRRPDILSRHLRRHTGEKPFGCNDCGRYFSRSDHLRTHRRTHTDEKPYKCTVCSYAARRRDVLTRHMSTRHQQKAERTFFPRQRRCISESINKPSNSTISLSMENIKQEPSQILASPKRQRYSTEIKTEIFETDPEEEEEGLEEDEDDEIIDVTNIEDDVVIDGDDENVAKGDEGGGEDRVIELN
jgi:DNA-directed RNA polymerase subunit RPC12/RpoP